MGAGASLSLTYQRASVWFRSYMDRQTYLDDFEAIDKDHDGGISFVELSKWIEAKAAVDDVWNLFNSSKHIIQLAHKNASVSVDSMSSSHAGKVVDVSEFKSLLLHLFSISILWKHFVNADNEKIGEDIHNGKHQLNLQQFTLAYRTLCKINANEEISDETIKEDFEMLDTNCNGTVGFNEVCNYCCRYITEIGGNDVIDEKKKGKVAQMLGTDSNIEEDNLMTDLSKTNKLYSQDHTSTEKTSILVNELKDYLDATDDRIKQVTEAEATAVSEKINTSAETPTKEPNATAAGATADTIATVDPVEASNEGAAAEVAE